MSLNLYKDCETCKLVCSNCGKIRLWDNLSECPNIVGKWRTHYVWSKKYPNISKVNNEDIHWEPLSKEDEEFISKKEMTL